ncbi:hypothetical protein [Spongiibacter tropicus]|uniref:hypothetical protein n=1 Tax=Spongiibacter tropicus TaxID=454602 RepID=UPI0023569C0C|nr:hypothetical protein [Spongiibacter tropicus]|tara:strand:+ start:62640 stop:62969 length:330 start_codon:yes stop_codon:yes gene_type:complete
MMPLLAAIQALSPHPDDKRIYRIAYFLACGGVLTGDLAFELFHETHLHSTISKLRDEGLQIENGRIAPKEPAHQYWIKQTPESLKAALSYLRRKIVADRQLSLLGGESQ